MVEVVAQLKNFRASAYKVRLVTDAVKGMPVDAAIARLRFINRRSAPVILKLIKSAVANASHNNRLDTHDLFIKSIAVNQALAMKRFKPAAFGSAHPVKKHACHIRVVLSVPAAKEEKIDTKKKAVKAEATAKKAPVVQTGAAAAGRTPKAPRTRNGVKK